MGNINDQAMYENNSLLFLNNDCVMKIFQLLSLVDFANVALTCRKLRDVAHDFSSRKHTKIQIDKPLALDTSISKREFSKVLSVIGEHVLQVKLYNNDSLLFKAVKSQCKNLKSIRVHYNYRMPMLQYLRNLTQLTLKENHVSINEWKVFFASNSELEELVLHGYDYKDGFMELLLRLPNLKILALPIISNSFHRDFQHLRRLTGLTKLSLRSGTGSDDNLNGILVDLTKNLNLVELDIWMIFNSESLEIIRLFSNLEVLSIRTKREVWEAWEEAWYSNATVFSPRLQRLKIQGIVISCSKFLEIIQHLTSLEEFDLGSGGTIYWDDKTIEKSQAMVIQAIKEALIRNRRELKIFRYFPESKSLYLHRSDHLQIINSYSVEQEKRSRRIFVAC